jgi:hypothetical protein
MIIEETLNNITKKMKYSPKTNKTKTPNKSKNHPNKNQTRTHILNTNPIPNNTNNYTIPPTQLIKLTQTIISQNTPQPLPKILISIINEAIASSSN